MNWITVEDAATAANRSIRTIYNWINAGRLHTRTDATGRTVVNPHQVLDIEPTIKRGRPRGTARPRALHPNDTP